MATIQTWYCGCGNNVFSSDFYDDENPPECGACGSMMTTDSEDFYNTIELVEIRGIAAFE